jgi:hypothetical protein
MCQPFGTNVTTACRLPHAKAITGQIIWHAPSIVLAITPQGAGVATGPVKFVVEALRRLVWTCLVPGDRWEIGLFAHTCTSVVGVSVDPSVVGRDWSPVSSNKARGSCCRTPGYH